MTNAVLWAQIRLLKMKESVKEFFSEERGDSNMIAVIILIVIVVALAIVFREQITDLVGRLWSSIFGEAGKATESMSVNVTK